MNSSSINYKNKSSPPNKLEFCNVHANIYFKELQFRAWTLNFF